MKAKKQEHSKESRTQQAIPAPNRKKAGEETFTRTCMSWETKDKKWHLAEVKMRKENKP